MVKVGDTIKLKGFAGHDEELGFVLGETYEVVSLAGGLARVLDNKGRGRGMFESQYEVIESELKIKLQKGVTYIVDNAEELEFLSKQDHSEINWGISNCFDDYLYPVPVCQGITLDTFHFGMTVGDRIKVSDLMNNANDQNKEEEEQVTEYKVGDIIKSLINDMDVTKWNHYQVIDVDEEADGDVLIIDDAGDHYFLDFENIELVDSNTEREIQVGDTVECASDKRYYFTKGSRYKVESIDSDGDYDVRDNDGDISFLRAHEVKLVGLRAGLEPQESETKPEEKRRPTVGDSVVVVQEPRYLSDDLVGKEGVVVRDTRDYQPYRIEIEGEPTFWYYEDEVELVLKPDPTDSIKKGDKVVVVKPSFLAPVTADGVTEYEVVSDRTGFDDDGFRIYINEEYAAWWLPESSLRKVQSNQSEEDQDSNEEYGVIKFTGLTQEQIKFYINSANTMLDQVLTALDENNQRVEFSLLNEEGVEELKSTDLDI